MPSINAMQTVVTTESVRIPRRACATRTALLGAALWLACAAAGASAAEPATAPVRSGELLPGLTLVIEADGSLRILGGAEAAEPLLTADLVGSESTLRARAPRPGDPAGPRPHLGRAAEGCPGGQRGFSARADDDGDTAIDEDPLDGRDNDEDGLIDEDFAAVSDAMIAITRPGPVGDDRFEYYHWAHARLQGAVFAAVGGPAGSRWQLTTGGTPWVDVRLAGSGHSVTGRPLPQTVTAFVSQVDPDGDCRGGNRWLGVAVLDEPVGSQAGRAVLDGRDLAVATDGASVAVVVCAAESWLQLARLLNDAKRVRAGVTDPVTGSQAPWIVAPACPACRNAAPPAYTWRTDRQGDLLLTAARGPEAAALPDPDLLRIGDLLLGSPDRIAWRPRGGQEQGVSWSCATADGLQRGGGHGSDPYAALDGVRAHDAIGQLEFRFVDPAPAVLHALGAGTALGLPAAPLTQVTLDGRRQACELAQDIGSGDPMRAAMALVRTGAAEEPSSPARQSQLLRSGRTQVQLSPELLQGWPNPFQEVISLGFRVPATIGEAFAWDDPEDQPTGLDLAAPVPWQQGAPEATVKIYTMSGQELVTLYAGQTGSGETVVNWNGTDAFGRKVASGTYFCKLQLDEWSVTRRLVYLR